MTNLFIYELLSFIRITIVPCLKVDRILTKNMTKLHFKIFGTNCGMREFFASNLRQAFFQFCSVIFALKYLKVSPQNFSVAMRGL